MNSYKVFPAFLEPYKKGWQLAVDEINAALDAATETARGLARSARAVSARAEAGGAVFTRHYALAPTTYFTVFGLLFGLEAHKLDAVVGAGRRPEAVVESRPRHSSV